MAVLSRCSPRSGRGRARCRGWGVGLACGLVSVGRRPGWVPAARWGPAGQVTVIRAALACAVAAVIAASVAQPSAALHSCSLTWSGWRARRWSTVGGAAAPDGLEVRGAVRRRDRRVLHARPQRLRLGDGRLVGAGDRCGPLRVRRAGWVLPGCVRAAPGYWRKVVTATQGIVLTVAAAGVAPRAVDQPGAGRGARLFAESFGRDVLWAWRHGAAQPAQVTGPPALPLRRP